MIDNEIIKALECCTKGTNSDVCVDCPLRTTDICTEEENGVLKLALDLINRQQAEIEKLQMMIDSDNEVCTECHCEYMDKVHQARIEAIKEFTEKLKENTIDVDVSYGYGREHYTEAVAVIEIDNLVKEMVGEAE